MGIKDQLTADQWKKLFNTLSATTTFVAVSSGGGFEMLKEALSASKFLTELRKKSGGSGYGTLVDDVMADIGDMTMRDVQENAEKTQAKSHDELRAETKAKIAEGIAVAETLPGGDGFKNWLYDMAKEVAETKTGGILGFGGTSVVDDQEISALDELRVILDL